MHSNSKWLSTQLKSGQTNKLKYICNGYFFQQVEACNFDRYFGNVSYQEHLSVTATNRYKIFKIFISKKFMYLGQKTKGLKKPKTLR